MTEIRIVVPWDASTLSANRTARMHWALKGRLTKEARAAARLAWFSAGEPKVEGPVAVRLIVRRARVMDADNAQSGCKALMDGLFSRRHNMGQGVTEDDGPEWVTLTGVMQETGKRWAAKPEVEFIINPRQLALEME